MGRPRNFDETDIVRRAADLFTQRAYDGVSVDDLVAQLGVHRHSLYRTFGSKRGLYLAALRWSSEHQVRALAARIAESADPYELLGESGQGAPARSGLDLLVLALVERAPQDREVARIVAEALAALDGAVHAALPDRDADAATGITAALLGLRARQRAAEPALDAAGAGRALTGGPGPH